MVAGSSPCPGRRVGPRVPSRSTVGGPRPVTRLGFAEETAPRAFPAVGRSARWSRQGQGEGEARPVFVLKHVHRRRVRAGRVGSAGGACSCQTACDLHQGHPRSVHRSRCHRPRTASGPITAGCHLTLPFSRLGICCDESSSNGWMIILSVEESLYIPSALGRVRRVHRARIEQATATQHARPTPGNE